MKFSERYGYVKRKTELEKNGVSEELRNSLWTVFITRVHKTSNVGYVTGLNNSLYSGLWMDFFKQPIDTMPTFGNDVSDDRAIQQVRDWFFEAEWQMIIDFVEYCGQQVPEAIRLFNEMFKREWSAYRFVEGSIVELISEEEFKELEKAINIEMPKSFSHIEVHVKKAATLMTQKSNPDYENSIKESISAVEAVVRMILGDQKETLGSGLRKLKGKKQIPPGLSKGFEVLYGYTANEGGIRHSKVFDGVDPSREEARYMLVTCSAVITYLIDTCI